MSIPVHVGRGGGEGDCSLAEREVHLYVQAGMA